VKKWQKAGEDCIMRDFITYMMCGYEVPRQAYLHTYSLLRGVTFKVLPLSSYAHSPMLETFFKLLL
jgi:hypothetical protein